MATLSRVFELAMSGGTPTRSLTAVLFVGAILNLINQGDALIGNAKLNVLKALLTFVVPFCVSTYGAVSVQLRHDRERAQVQADRSGRIPPTGAETVHQIGEPS